jgi:rubrerythrin
MSIHERVLQMLRTALEMEEKGMSFYDKAISQCTNEVGNEIFHALRQDEVAHTERIKIIFSSLEGGGSWTDEWTKFELPKGDMKSFFYGLAKKHGENVTSNTSDIEALDIGIDFEKRAVTYYEEQLSLAEEEVEKKFIVQMIDEEKHHHELLTEMKLYLSDPAAWFVEYEHQGFDGA